MAGVWQRFLELHRARGSSGFGPAPITYVDVKAWMEVTGRRLDAWDLSVVQKLDALWLTQFAKSQEREAKRGK